MKDIGFRLFKYYLFDQFLWKHKIKEYKKEENYFRMMEKLLFDEKFLSWQEKKLADAVFTVFDLETTGFLPTLGDEIVSMGAVKVNCRNEQIEKPFYQIVKPFRRIPNEVYSITGFSKNDIANGVDFLKAFDRFYEYSKNTILVAHPASFDVMFLQKMVKRWGLPSYNPPFLDSYSLAKYLYPNRNIHLDSLILRHNIPIKERHHALNDALMTAQLFFAMMDELNFSKEDSVQKLCEAFKTG
ncbi:3'-5' exonuclease [Bacillus taeanensis]|uniref:3'-5' exonuclease n=1 Tax=Bacillus taeanensis TaxID=273032 RepID=A0A366XU79_9BACI|nr:3'-5' exonuclease [Bacillus taeanensis]RBW69457.1 3'-5' exonuclease [Bacillus taeanensis]